MFALQVPMPQNQLSSTIIFCEVRGYCESTLKKLIKKIPFEFVILFCSCLKMYKLGMSDIES